MPSRVSPSRLVSNESGTLPWSPGRAYAASVTVTVLFGLLQAVLHETLGAEPIVVVLVIPIILSAYVGGLRPGLVSTAIGVLVSAGNLFVRDHGAGIVFLALTRLLALGLSGVLISALVEALHRSHDAAVASQREGEKSQHDTEVRLATVVNSADDGILTVDQDQRITFFNPAAETIFRYPATEIIGQPLSRLIPSRFHGQHVEDASAFVDHGTTKRRTGGLAVVGLRADGTEFPAEVSIARAEVGGRPVVTAIVRDITERHRAEAALRESEARFRELAAAVREVFVMIDAMTGRIVYVSPAYPALSGRPADAAPVSIESCDEHDASNRPTAGRRRLPVGPGGDRGHLRVPLHAGRRRVARAPGHRLSGARREGQGGPRRRDHRGHHRAAHARGPAPASAEDGVGRPARERHRPRLQQPPGGNPRRLADAHARRVGRGAAHARRRDPRRGRTCRQATRQLLAFSRRAVFQPQLIDLNTVVSDSEKMLGRLLGEDIEVETALETPLGEVNINPGLWVQVLMNLAVNARDAMPRGGRLRIETRELVLGEAHVAEHPGVKPGRYVLVSFNDTGTGMPPEVKARVFEPFFTTKPMGRGTGLGLSVVDGIIAQSGGHIELESEPDKGTTFRIYLPVAHPSDAPPAVADEGAAASGKETVLVVEDDDAVRRVMLRSLGIHGCDVLAASGGEEALAILDACKGRVDLLITDVVMPKMSGRQLSDAVRGRYPQVKVLFTSGYADDTITRHGVVASEVVFLQKPFTVEALLAKVREALRRTD